VLLSVAGRVLDVDALVYLPVFLAGTLLAVRVEDVRAWGARRSRGFWIAAGTVSGATLIAGWLARPLIRPDTTGGTLLWGMAAAGAVGLVVTALGSPGAGSALSRAVPRWLGRVSFSLYLVHVPVLMTLGYLWGEAAWPAVLAVGIPASLLLAECFTRLVETPSHRLALRVRRALSRDGERQPAAPAATVP
jgi:peptidoglycan/LPS O-acetylase OafA/YrhL